MSKLEIPESWAPCAVGDVFELRNGYAFKSSEFSKTGVKVVRISNIQDGSVDIAEAVCVKEHHGFEKFRTGRGDLLIAMSGATTGKMGVFELDDTAYQNQRVGNIKIKADSTIDPRFRDQFFRLIQNDILKEAYGGAQPNISGAMIEKFDFGLPPLGEQKRIVAKIESTQEKIKTIEQSVTKAEELIGKYREALLQKAFRGELVPQDPNDEPASKLLERIRADRAKQADGKKKKKDDLPPIGPEEIPFEIPKSWEWVRLGNILEVHSGDNLTANKQADGSIPVYGGNGIAGYHNCPNLNESHIVIGRVGAKCGAVHVTPEQSWVTDNALIVDANYLYFDQLWLALVLRHLNFNSLSNSSAQPVISGSKIYQVLLPVPPKSEQIRIRTLLAAQDHKVDSFREQINSIAKILDSSSCAILKCAFSGRLVPQVSTEGTGHELLDRIKSQGADEATRATKQPKLKPKKRTKA